MALLASLRNMALSDLSFTLCFGQGEAPAGREHVEQQVCFHGVA